MDMDMELENIGTQEPQETHDDGEFDEMLKDLWGDDYTTEDDEGADPAPRRETEMVCWWHCSPVHGIIPLNIASNQ